MVVILVLPGWLAVAKKRDKRSIFIFGAAWWSASQILIFLADPDWPRWVIFAIPAVAALGYAVADLMPWAMLGEVIDEDELATGERREGMYVGCFMLLRKVGGATAVLSIGLLLQFSDFVGEGGRSDQPELALQTIRTLTSLVPMAFLLGAIAVAMRYPLTRAVHAEIIDELRRRRGASKGDPSLRATKKPNPCRLAPTAEASYSRLTVAQETYSSASSSSAYAGSMGLSNCAATNAGQANTTASASKRSPSSISTSHRDAEGRNARTPVPRRSAPSGNCAASSSTSTLIPPSSA